MRFRAKSIEGKEVEGQYIAFEGLQMVLVKKDESGVTTTKVIPDTVEEIE